ncbi:MAG: phospholipase D-like domain-containing protein [Candidatus Marsarchaeota archaeon]|nr:phospholipase D-like domain-containing protein [Candidatus Marsarchaeota archaeon]
MFGLPTNRGTSYSGDSSYKLIDQLIEERGGTLRVISPFISPSYARKLIKEASRKKVYVITSATGYDSNKQAAGMLLKKGKRYHIRPIFYMAMLFIAGIYVGVYLFSALMVLAIAIAIFANYTMNRSRSSNLNVKIARGKFVHEKLYLTDKSAIVGSANLTYAGTHKNIEHIELIKDRDKIREFSRHFESLWNEID